MTKQTIAQRVLGIKAEYVSYSYPCRNERRIKSGIPYLNKSICRKNLLDIKSVFDRHQIKFFLSYGTLLGALREKDFITHDIDTELGIFAEQKEQFINAIKELLLLGFDLIRTSDPDDVVTIIRDDEIVDIGIFRKVKDERNKDYFVYQKNRVYGVNLCQLIPYVFLDTQFLIPSNAEKLLEQWYGSDWKIPKINAPAWSYNYPKWKKMLHKHHWLVRIIKHAKTILRK